MIQKLLTAMYWCLSLILPIKTNRIVFCSYYGRGYSDNPKAIAQALLASGRDLEMIWLVNNRQEAETLPEGILPCPYHSPRRIWALASAKVWVDNCRKYDRFKKKNQYYLQTWHGFPLKRIERDALDSLAPDFERGAVRDSRHTDLLLSGSRHTTDVLRRSFWYDGEIGQFGSPRNDVFFSPQREIRQKVLKHFALPRQTQLLLYAPTFRADKSTAAYAIDVERALAACQARFPGPWAALIRLHPNVAEQSSNLFPYDARRVLDATAYPDMQELLCAADLLITDYSSSMFDYALSGKPCIQFALDMEDYRKDRNFYFPLDSLPFPLATSNEELSREICSLDTDLYRQRWAAFAQAQGICEDGQAAQRCANWILDRIDGKA